MKRTTIEKINVVIFDDEITLYWDKQWELPDNILYRISLDGRVIGETQKTHFEIRGLQAQREYKIEIARLDQNAQTAELLLSETLKTEKSKKRIDVTKPPYNADWRGERVNTAILQQAINDCKADEVVYFPRGCYKTGALELHSDMELYLDACAVLQGTNIVEDYAPKRLSRYEGKERMCYRPLLNMGTMDRNGGYNCKNVVVRGGGIVSGGGIELCWNVIHSEKEALKEYLENNAEYVKTCESSNTVPGRARPRLVCMNNCENIVLSNVTFQYGSSWNVHFVYSKDILTYGCTIRSEGIWNGDGWDPDSSEDCTIFGTTFSTYDDGIAIKSGKNPEGNIINRPTKNIRIFDCHGKNGVAIGSELSGGISDIYIWDCNFIQGSITGVTTKSTRKRGGYVKNVRVRNCKLADIRLWTGYTCNDDDEGSGELTTFENYHFENIEIKGVNPYKHEGEFFTIYVEGFDEEEHHFNNVTFKNVTVRACKDKEKQKAVFQNVKNLTVENLVYLEDA